MHHDGLGEDSNQRFLNSHTLFWRRVHAYRASLVTVHGVTESWTRLMWQHTCMHLCTLMTLGNASLRSTVLCVWVPSHCTCVRFFVTSWTVVSQVPLSMELSRQECWSGLPCPPPGDLPNPGIRPVSLMASFIGRQGSLPLVPPGNWYWNQEKNKSSFLVLLRIEMLSCNLPSRRYFIFYLCFFSFIYLFIFKFTILYLFCHALTWIHHGCTCIPHPEPSSHLPPHPIPLGHPSAPVLSTLYQASNLYWQFVHIW